jgi:hypothetical protein
MKHRRRPVTDLTKLPLLLTLDEVATIYRISIKTIRNRLSNGTFHLPPFATYPYRWRRSDVEADLQRPPLPIAPARYLTRDATFYAELEAFVRRYDEAREAGPVDEATAKFGV